VNKVRVRASIEDSNTTVERKKRMIIAIVEDDASLIEMFSDTLALSGQWQVHVFSDGESARDQIPDLGAHLVILDVGLPNLDGASLYKILRGHSNTRNIPIIVITGSHEWELHRMGLQAGFLLQKPFSPSDLMSMIQALVPN